MSNKTSNKLLSNLLQGSVLLVLLVAASYVSMGRILIANVDSYRSEIKSVLSEALGVPIQIGKLQGGWTYLDPRLEIENLALGVEEQISIDQLAFAIDAVASIQERTPVFRSVTASGVRLQVKKQDGKWVIAGLRSSDKPFDPKPLLKSLDYLVTVELADFALEVIGETTSLVLVSETGRTGELRRSGELLSFALPMQLQQDDIQSSLFLAGQFDGPIGEETGSGNLYLRLPGVNAIELLPHDMTERLQLTRISLGGEFWATLEGKYFELQGKTEVDAGFDSIRHKLQTTQEFAARGHLAGEIVASITRLSGDFGGVNWRFDNIGVSVEPGPEGTEVAIQVPELDVAELVATPLALGRRGIGLTEAQVESLAALNPQGKLSKLFMTIQFGDVMDYRVVGNLQHVSVERYQALPVISDLNGLIHLGPRGGFMDVVNEAPFSMQFPGLFDQEWYFDTAKTRVTYEVTDAGIQAQTGLVEANLGDLIAHGRVHLRIPGPRLETTWGLELGVRNANLLDSFRYLPNTLKEDVRGWMRRAILAGYSHESGMLFHGSLAKEAAKDQKAHQLYFEVEDTILDYDANWPRFDETAATIFVDNFEVSSDDATGRMFDSEIYDSTVMVPISAEGVVDSILIDGKVRGDFADGVRLLTETPLAEATSEMAEGWVAVGEMTGVASLNIPMGPRAEAGIPTWASATIQLEDTNLKMTSYDLDFSHLAGTIHYDTNTAVSVEQFEAELFGQKLTGSVVSEGDAEGGEIIVRSNGKIASNDLYVWADQPLLSRASGIINYQTDLHVFYGNRGDKPIYIKATSDLVGVEIAMPEPIYKRADEASRLVYKQTFSEPGYRIDLELGDEVQAQLRVDQGSLAGGQLHFGSSMPNVVSFDKLSVSGYLEHVVYEEWDALSVALESLSDGSMEEELEKTLNEVKVDIGLFDVFGFEMDAVLTRITRDPGYWRVDLTNEWLEGRVSVSDDVAAPLEINMRRLQFDSDEETESIDPLEDVNPSELALAKFSVDKLVLDDDDYGSWAFLYEPGDDYARLSNMQLNVKGLKVGEDASVLWRVVDGKHTSEFSGFVAVPDLGSALQQWGYASSIVGQDFSFKGDVSWEGSPAMVDIDVIDGNIKLIKGEGRFVQADSNMGALRLLGIFDFASIARRFRLDFSDVVETGFSFNKIEGETRFSSGIIDVVEPIMIEGSGSTFKVAGRVDLDSLELDNDMVVTLPVNRNLPWYAAYSAFATGPLTGAGVFLVQQVFQNQINAISSAKYKITGTMDEPVIEFVTFFSDSVREAPEMPPAGE